MSTKSRWRLPAEWEPQRELWTAFPASEAEWGRYLPSARREVADLCHMLTAPTTQPRIQLLVREASVAAPARELLRGANVELVEGPYGDIWLRDTAPVFATDGQQLRATVFRFNGWGGKYLMDGDEHVAEYVASHSDTPMHELPFVGEGGAIESDGEGTVLTTRSCLLNPNRNPEASEEQLDAALREALGVRQVIWLDQGLLYDHTDGHIDNVARFAAPGSVVCMHESGANDPQKHVLPQIERALGTCRDAAGRRFEVLSIPSPGYVRGPDREPMPASYCNFIISGRRVVVPVFGTRFDGPAVDAIASIFPDHEVDGREAWHILTGGGTFHCITQPVPQLPASTT